MIAVLGVHAGRVPPGTEELLSAAAVVAGGREVLAALAPPRARQVTLGADLDAALVELTAACGDACVLASGDPGFFGIVRLLSERVPPDELIVHPAPSSVAVAFGRLGLPWDDALVLSAHARDPRPALHAALRHPKVAILTSPAAGPDWFIARLTGREDRRIAVAERLGQPEERIHTGSAKELAGISFADPNVLLVLEATEDGRRQLWPPRTPTRWALPNESFDHRDGMITKAEVRAVILARLGPGVGDLVWDVGCGSGSVAVECARLGAAVVAIDRDPDAVRQTRQNAEAHSAPVQVVAGTAPADLDALPDPDAVFIGGGGHDLEAILAVCCRRRPRSVVLSLAVVERVGPALAVLAEHGYDASGSGLAISRLRPMPGGHRLAAENPVFVITGERR